MAKGFHPGRDLPVETFGSGAVRDVQDGKPLYGSIPPKPLLRVAMRYTEGAEKYGYDNWEAGMPTSRICQSLMRHLEAARRGETDEDHLAAVCWNAIAWMHFEGTEHDDMKDRW